ncbi:unnamed protein product [Dibothriocephalus latus]|uniref:Uncharacterized protein n=1 Tax=Dibothriocephalus latus TaxID=60516 RepID=A0A3P7QQ53_DIBLA|nr:unnamed protein product [Dibothriocephalus latus]
MHTSSNPLEAETQEKLNQLIKCWWVGDRTYMALQAACQGDNAMPGFADYFHLLGIRCRVQAELTTKYVTLRGGKLKMDTYGPITDVDLMYYIGKKMMRHQTRSIYWAARHITGLENSNSAYLYDRLTMRPLVARMTRDIYAHRSSKWAAMTMQMMSPAERAFMENDETTERQCQ